jgi:hypothetical protein
MREDSFGEGKNAGQQAKKGELTTVVEVSSISTSPLLILTPLGKFLLNFTSNRIKV